MAASHIFSLAELNPEKMRHSHEAEFAKLCTDCPRLLAERKNSSWQEGQGPIQDHRSSKEEWKSVTLHSQGCKLASLDTGRKQPQVEVLPLSVHVEQVAGIQCKSTMKLPVVRED